MKTSMTLIFTILLLSGCSADFWLTDDQQGDRLMQQGKFVEAAKSYQDPFRSGVAYYRGGDYKKAASVFGRLKTADGQFNCGNALVMLGKYDEAAAAYQTAMQARPGWREAEENFEIARLRAEKLQKEGGDMTGGKLAADEIVFTSGNKDGGGQEESAGGEQISDQTLQALWLRRIQTKPADFLKAKFAYQLAREDGEREGGK